MISSAIAAIAERSTSGTLIAPTELPAACKRVGGESRNNAAADYRNHQQHHVYADTRAGARGIFANPGKLGLHHPVPDPEHGERDQQH
jgi:hypothetical protein